MTTFRIFLLALFISIVAYTLVTGLTHGWNLVPVFIGDMAEMSWRGQFNFDFMTFLLLTGVWVAWRNGFTVRAIALGAAASVLGMTFLSAYLIYLTFKTDGNMQAVLMGVHAGADAERR